jgi:hypothetical protein
MNTIIYPGSGPGYEVIALRPTFFVWKKDNVTMGLVESSRTSLSVREKMSCLPLPEG